MLSKVAERVYWTARYIERVENTARMVAVYTNLLLDLPKGVNLGWYNLVALSSLENTFTERYKVQDERNVVKFLLADEKNPVSVVSSLNMLRENVRTTRDVVPVETWELINELSIFVSENSTKALNRGQRHECLEGIVRGCQRINGLLYGTMTHDEAWDFLRLGRNLERADMTTRLLDAGCAAILQTQSNEAAVNARQIIWGNVLRSVGGEQSYRRKLRSAVQGSEVARYLLEDPQFPRTIQHCLAAIADSAAKLPRCEPVNKAMKSLQARVFKEVNYEDLGAPMREYLNTLQVELGQLHSAFAKQWFN
jgi:uncharacterized alpha-E superfamily protein